MSKKIKMFKVCEPYARIGREILMVDPLETDEKLPIYTRDIASKAHVTPKNGTVPTSNIEPESILVPLIDIASKPTVKDKIEDDCEYCVADRLAPRSEDAIKAEEDYEVLRAINAAVPAYHSISVYGFNPENLFLAFALIEEHDLTPASIVVHPQRLKDMRAWEHPEYYEFKKGKHPYRATFYNTKVYVTRVCTKNVIYVLAAPEYVGVIPIREDISETDVAEAEHMRKGKLVTESIGVAVLNDYATARIIVSGCSKKPTAQDEDDLPAVETTEA